MNDIPNTERELIQLAIDEFCQATEISIQRWILISDLFNCSPEDAKLICERYDRDPDEIISGRW
jgi:hypothetical protein